MYEHVVALPEPTYTLFFKLPLAFIKKSFSKASTSYAEDFLRVSASKVNHTLSNPHKATLLCNPSQKFEQRERFSTCHIGQFNWTSLCWMGHDFKTWQDLQTEDPECYL